MNALTMPQINLIHTISLPVRQSSGLPPRLVSGWSAVRLPVSIMVILCLLLLNMFDIQSDSKDFAVLAVRATEGHSEWEKDRKLWSKTY